MRMQVKEEGLVIPKGFLKGIDEVEVKREDDSITITPITKKEDNKETLKNYDDPIWKLGSNPGHSGLRDGAINHDKYIYGKGFPKTPKGWLLLPMYLMR